MKSKPPWIARFWKKLGPGLITGASDDDPSGIATYSQAGAGFGLSTLWLALFSLPLMAAMQEMCARIGLVTSQGLTGTLKRHYSKSLVYLLILFSFPAIVLNIGADIAAMGAVSNLLFPSIHASIFSIFFTLALLYLIIRLPYQQIARALKWLCLVLMCYLIVPFLVKQDIVSIIRQTFLPSIHFSKGFMAIVVGILGTTISPYLFFWQTSVEVEEVKQKKIMVDKKILNEMKFDVDFGMFFSNLVMYFIILSTGTILFNGGITQINTVEEAARALKPLAGDAAYLLFAIGIIGTGLLAVPVLAGSLSYILSETLGWHEGLNKKFKDAKGFYYIMIISMLLSLVVIFSGISPVQALIYTAVLYGMTAPVLIAIILHISNNPVVMGKHTNTRRSNILGILAFLLMTAASLVLLYLQFFG